MKPRFVLTGLLTFGLGVSSCSKKQNDNVDSAPPSATQTDAPAASSPAAIAPSTVEDQDANAQLKDLRLQVDAYEKMRKHKPASLDQMVQEGFMNKLPEPPPGKRFDYDPATARVTLVSR